MAKKVAVIGAGPMGLAVAYELAKQGIAVEVFEAAPVAGGMAASFDFSGTRIERYYHFHCTSDLDFMNLLKELDIEEHLKWTATKMGYWHPGKLQSWGDPISLLKFKDLSLISKIRYGLFAFISTRRNKWSELDKKNAIPWIKWWVGDKAFEKLWSPLFYLKFYEFSNNLSAAWIWSRIRRIGRSRYSLFKEKLGYLSGGSELLINALCESIERGGGAIHLKQPVTEIVLEGDQAKGLIAGGKKLDFDAVISTVPMPYVPAMLQTNSPKLAEKYVQFQNIGVACVIFKMKNSVTPYFWVNTIDPEMDIPGVIEYSNLNGETKEKIVYVPYYMPTDNPKYSEPDEVFTQKVRDYLMKINPSLTEDDFLDQVVSRYRFAQPICEPDFLASLPSTRPGNSNLWIADTSFYYPEDRGISESVGFGKKIAIECFKHLHLKSQLPG